ncbi:MAG: hypothetical protein M1484_02235 [Patescibacteria group bacterium]|nr:hypothetical protein [Patescibacteria group bacterium]
MLSKEALEQFKTLYKQEYGVNLTDQIAEEFGNKLVTLVKAVYGDNLPDIDKNGKREKNGIVLK